MDQRFFCFSKCLLILALALHIGCTTPTNQHVDNLDKSAEPIKESHENKQIKERSNNPFSKYHAKSGKQAKRSTENYTNSQLKIDGVPKKTYDVLDYVLKHKQAPANYVGGRRFGNFEGHLPRKDLEGRRIEYQEWDVNPKNQGRNRGVERLVTGSDGRAWYTSDHYNSFIEIK